MRKLAWLLMSPLLASPLFAADLMQVYRDAQDNDLCRRPRDTGCRP